MIALLLALTAHAGEGYSYAKPVLSARTVYANGQTWPLLTGGGVVGYAYALDSQPTLVSNSRLRVTGTWGMRSQSLGLDARLGSFFGPRLGPVDLRLGPDLSYSVYGTSSSPDYHLPGSFGVAVRTTAAIEVHEAIDVLAWLVPGWQLNPARQGDIGPFHELSTGAVVALHGRGGPRVNLGYQWTWNVAGLQHGVVLTGGL